MATNYDDLVSLTIQRKQESSSESQNITSEGYRDVIFSNFLDTDPTGLSRYDSMSILASDRNTYKFKIKCDSNPIETVLVRLTGMPDTIDNKTLKITWKNIDFQTLNSAIFNGIFNLSDSNNKNIKSTTEEFLYTSSLIPALQLPLVSGTTYKRNRFKSPNSGVSSTIDIYQYTTTGTISGTNNNSNTGYYKIKVITGGAANGSTAKIQTSFIDLNNNETILISSYPPTNNVPFIVDSSNTSLLFKLDDPASNLFLNDEYLIYIEGKSYTLFPNQDLFSSLGSSFIEIYYGTPIDYKGSSIGSADDLTTLINKKEATKTSEIYVALNGIWWKNLLLPTDATALGFSLSDYSTVWGTPQIGKIHQIYYSENYGTTPPDTLTSYNPKSFDYAFIFATSSSTGNLTFTLPSVVANWRVMDCNLKDAASNWKMNTTVYVDSTGKLTIPTTASNSLIEITLRHHI